MRTHCLADAIDAEGQSLAVPAHPSNLPRRHADHEGEVRHIPIHHRSGANEGKPADRCATDDRAVCSERGAALDNRVTVLALSLYSGPRVVDIGKDHARSAKDIVFKGDVVVDRDIVLDLDAIAYPNPVADEYILAEGAITTDNGPPAYVDKMPDSRSVSKNCTIINNGALMRGEASHRAM
jgi:hypothetical protein